MLERLGVQGMSSDESDREEVRTRPAARLHTPKFRNLLPRWRSKELANWLHVFDSIHMISRRTGGSSSQGAFPRLRIHNIQSPKYSNSRAFVSQLPLNAYSMDWLNARNDVDFLVQPDNQEYDFSHDDDIFEYVIRHLWFDF